MNSSNRGTLVHGAHGSGVGWHLQALALQERIHNENIVFIDAFKTLPKSMVGKDKKVLSNLDEVEIELTLLAKRIHLGSKEKALLFIDEIGHYYQSHIFYNSLAVILRRNNSVTVIAGTHIMKEIQQYRPDLVNLFAHHERRNHEGRTDLLEKK